MLIGGIDKFLFNPAVNNTFAALDNSRSMFSIATRDLVDSSGRTVMEYKRDKHGGRERLIEEFVTFGIWGFGIKAMKNVYDWGITNVPLLKKTGVHLPDLDIDLLPAAGKKAKEGVQKLDLAKVEAFARQFKDVEQYKKLVDVVKDSKLHNAYRGSNAAKFLFATGIPIVALAFGVPTMNQWLTKQKLSKQGNANPAGAQEAQSPVPTLQAKNPKQAVNNAFGGFQPYSANVNNAFNRNVNAFNQFKSQVGSKQTGQGKQVQFGGLGSQLASWPAMLLQNEQYNTLLVDGVLSGGRVYKGRNPIERFEIFFREASIIAFLYAIQRPLQNFVGSKLGQWMKIPANLEFKTMKHLYDNKEFRKNPGQFRTQFEKSEKTLTNSLNKIMGGGKNSFKNLLDNPEAKEKALVESIHKYFLKNRATNKNMILETAVDAGWIPTFEKNPKQAATSWVDKFNPLKEKAVDADNLMLDLTKKIDTKSIFGLKNALGDLASKNPAELEGLLKKSMRLRGGAWFLSNAVCFSFLSIIIPSLQHYITYKWTGKDYFPGVQAK